MCDEWKAAAIVLGAYHFKRMIERYGGQLPPEFKIAASLIDSTIDLAEYESAAHVIDYITNEVMYGTTPEAVRLKDHLGLKTVN